MRSLIEKIESENKMATDDLELPEMVSAFETSSNVHSFGYDYAQKRLYVRFQKESKSGRSKMAGPLYVYYNVPERIFTQMYMAKSRGQFVWERLRERYRYKLIGRAGWRLHSPKTGQRRRVGPKK